MSQHDMVIDNAGGSTVRADLNGALQALASTSKGSSRPATVYTGQLWLDDNTPSASVWTLYLYDGSDDIPLGTFDTTTNLFTVTNTAPVMVGDSGSGGTAGAAPAPAAGDADKYLKGDGTYERGARRLLATKTPTAASSVTFLAADGFDAAKYIAYEIEFTVLPATDAADLQVTVSTDGGATWKTGATDYNWLSFLVSGGGVAFPSGNSAYIRSIADISNATGEGASGTFKIMSRGAGVRATTVDCDLTRFSSGGVLHIERSNGYYSGSTAINGFKFAMSAGTMTGVLQIYGIAK